MNRALKNSAGKSLNDALAPFIVHPETRLFSSPSLGEREFTDEHKLMLEKG